MVFVQLRPANRRCAGRSKARMATPLERELKKGTAAAARLVEHLDRMNAAMTTKPLKSEDGVEFVVIVGRKADLRSRNGKAMIAEALKK